jgi:ElaB/YqjD/DUF883 family membrane-anchored ribosome-binding protein
MATRSKVSSNDEIAAIQDLMEDLEKRLGRLSGNAKREASGASNDIHDFVNDALGSIMERVREGTNSVSQSVADKAIDFGSDTLKKITDEVEQRPFAMLAIAVGIGFLFGISRR